MRSAPPQADKLGVYHLFLASEGFPLNEKGSRKEGGADPLRFCLGVGKLTECIDNPSWDQFQWLRTQHHVILAEKGGSPPDMSAIYLWQYTDITAFCTPLPCSPKRSCVTWNTLIQPAEQFYPAHRWKGISPSYPGQPIEVQQVAAKARDLEALRTAASRTAATLAANDCLRRFGLAASEVAVGKDNVEQVMLAFLPMWAPFEHESTDSNIIHLACDLFVQETRLLMIHDCTITDPLQALAPGVSRAVLAVQREGSGSVVYHLHSTLHLSHIGTLLIACAMAALPQPVRVYPAASVVAFWQKCGFSKVSSGSSELRDDVLEWSAHAAPTIECVSQKVAERVPQTGADAIIQVQMPQPPMDSLIGALVIAARSGPGSKDSPWNLLILGLGSAATNLLVSALVSVQPSSPLELGVWHDGEMQVLLQTYSCNRVQSVSEFDQSVSDRGAFLSCIAICARVGATEVSRALRRISPSGVCALPICSFVSPASA